MIDTRLATLLVWGLGTVVVYGIVLVQRIRNWRIHKDIRARRDVVSGFALFLTALLSAAGITLVLFGEVGSTMRGFAVALALGAFTGAGMVMASEGSGRETKE